MLGLLPAFLSLVSGLSLALPSPSPLDTKPASDIASSNTTTLGNDLPPADCIHPGFEIDPGSAGLCLSLISDWAMTLPGSRIRMHSPDPVPTRRWGTLPFRQLRRSDPNHDGMVYTCDLSVKFRETRPDQQDMTNSQALELAARSVVVTCLVNGMWGGSVVGVRGAAVVQVASNWEREGLRGASENVTEVQST